jgi:hypothetical protein
VALTRAVIAPEYANRHPESLFQMETLANL